MSVLLDWFADKLAGPILAALAVLFAMGFFWQTAQIDGWPIFGGGYKAEIAALQSQAADVKTAAAKFQADAARLVADRQAAIRTAQDKAAAAYQDGLDHSRRVIQTLIQKVPVYVSQKSDAACVVPWGAVRLFDAAASGSDPGAVAAAIAAGQPDDAASPVKLSDFIALLAQNFSAARDNADQLKRLEEAVAAK